MSRNMEYEQVAAFVSISQLRSYCIHTYLSKNHNQFDVRIIVIPQYMIQESSTRIPANKHTELVATCLKFSLVPRLSSPEGGT